MRQMIPWNLFRDYWFSSEVEAASYGILQEPVWFAIEWEISHHGFIYSKRRNLQMRRFSHNWPGSLWSLSYHYTISEKEITNADTCS